MKLKNRILTNSKFQAPMIARIILLIVMSIPFLHASDIRISGANHAEYWVFVDYPVDSLNYN